MSPEGPIKASDVAPSTEKSPAEIRRENIKKAAVARTTRRDVVARKGGDVRNSSDGLAADLERTLGNIDKRSTRAFKARKVVDERIGR